MRRSALAAAILGALSLGLTACGADAPELEEQTLSFTVRDADDFSFKDNPPKTKLGKEGPENLSPGDELTLRGEFVDASDKDIGDLDVACTVTKAGPLEAASEQCTGTASLPGGTMVISVGGRAFSDEPVRGAVIGGTGKYTGATGTFRSKDTGGISKDVFQIFLPK